jgi:hypothetical protein
VTSGTTAIVAASDVLYERPQNLFVVFVVFLRVPSCAFADR